MTIFTPERINRPNTYNVGGKEWEVEGYIKIKVKETGEKFLAPLVNIPMMTDYQWFEECLKSRIEHPERYEANEDLPSTIEYIKKWLVEHKPLDS